MKKNTLIVALVALFVFFGVVLVRSKFESMAEGQRRANEAMGAGNKARAAQLRWHSKVRSARKCLRATSAGREMNAFYLFVLVDEVSRGRDYGKEEAATTDHADKADSERRADSGGDN